MTCEGERGVRVSGSAPESKGASAFTPINVARAFVVLMSDKRQFVVMPLIKSGGKPTFPTPSFSNVCLIPTLKGCQLNDPKLG